ncbi:MAG: hypothetical protein LBF12_01660 [Christensenellaceae bacterium]|nr:hypothetical protein [Christensenellaceae bacterium]
MLLYLILANVGNKKLAVQSTVRTIELKKEAFDAQSYLESFDDAHLTTECTITSFTGSQKIDSNLLDYLSDVEGLNYDEPEFETLIQYFATYDSESNVVTLSAKIIMSDAIEELDEIYGLAFIDKNGEIDAVMNVDGESILLSEMKQQVLIENCGWLSKLIKVAVAAVVVNVCPIIASVVVLAVITVKKSILQKQTLTII